MTTLVRPKLADVYIEGARNVAVETTPGRKLNFFGGHATVTDERDLAKLLGMANIRVDVHPDGVHLVQPWVDGRGELNPIRATVSFPSTHPVECVAADPPVVAEDEIEAGWITDADDAIDLEDLFRGATVTEKKPGRKKK